MNDVINFSLLIFVIGVFAFFITKKLFGQNIMLARIFLISGFIFITLYLTELIGILDFCGTYTQNVLYGISLSSFLLAMRFGISNKILKFFNWTILILNTPFLHTLFLILFSSVLNINLYKIPTIVKLAANYRIESENNVLGMSMNENVYYIEKNFPFEKKSQLFTLPRSKYLDSLKITDRNNKIHIQYLGRDSLDIDTTFNIK
ncbi:hypothetical protein [Chryseobacterium sp. Leaf394]|uniref:hypothetical protein n=1 Tax=Chryseobacterium sp. Leaf394 TaxID=1736361 RepID=UPI0006F1C689|nr:hypothetical protein [Chryseobacterium sp. Leaf394]KQS89348.1 hypothetical protein ASG21_16330 [Chryseobacterium sp. Leaf394]